MRRIVKPDWVQVMSLEVLFEAEAQAWVQAGMLHVGEAEAIALVRQTHADLFLTDDTAARLFALTLGLEVHGSLGIVLWAAARGHLNRKETERLIILLDTQSTLWLSHRVVSQALVALERLFP